jgi:hypothetical protein
MARTAVTPAQGTRNAGIAPTITTIDSTLVTNGVTIASAKIGKLQIRVNNTHAATQVMTIRAGDSLYPAWMKGQGDMAVSLAASTGEAVVPALDSARFKQSDGSLHIDFDAGTTGTLETYYLP